MPFLRGKWTNADIQWTFDGQNAKKGICSIQPRKIDVPVMKNGRIIE